MKEIMFRGEPIRVLSASGYHDGYYWDMNATIEYKGETYQLFDAGSGSGYILCCSAIKKGAFDRLYGEKQSQIEENNPGYFESTICVLLQNFIDSGAKDSWECYDDDEDWHTHILVDGKEVNDGEEEEAQ